MYMWNSMKCYMMKKEIDRILSIILEYGEESTLTIHRVVSMENKL